MLAAVRCPVCTAPVRSVPAGGEILACAYCGAALTNSHFAEAGTATSTERTEVRFAIVVRMVGPSNLERVARVLHERSEIEVREVRARLERLPCEVMIGGHEEQAQEARAAVVESGALAEVVSRLVHVPLLTVTLDDPGDNRLAVITAIRSEVELGLAEARHLVGTAPCVIVTGVEDAVAQALVASLEAAGAKAHAR